MKKSKTFPKLDLVLALIAFVFVTLAVAEGPVVLIDFGINTNETASPDVNGNTWNNFSAAGTLSNLLTTTNTPSTIQATTSGLGVANTNGTTVPDAALGSLAVANATRDSFFVGTGGTGTLTLSGLSSSYHYRLECFGSRDAAAVRITRYTATGATSSTATLQTSGSGIGLAPQGNANHNTLAVLENLRPTPEGALTLHVTIESGEWAYLGALRLTRTTPSGDPNTPPMASDLLVVGAPAVGRNVRVHYTYTDAEGDPEGDTGITWQFAQPPFSDPQTVTTSTNTDFTLTPPGPGEWYVRAVVEPIAVSGVTVGNEAPSAWLGPIAPDDTITVFHIGNSFTRWGNIPQQLKNLATLAGYNHTYGVQLQDGAGLSSQWNNGITGANLTEGTPSRLQLATGSWDWVVLQPLSREWQPDRIAGFLNHAGNFGALAAANGTRVLLYNYWNYLSETPAEQDSIDAAFETVRSTLASNGVDVVVLPAGKAFGQAATDVAGFTRPQLYQDDLHPSHEGYYLSAHVHFAVIYQQSPQGLTHDGISANPGSNAAVSFDPALAAAFQEIAWDVARFHSHSGVTRGRFEDWASVLPAHLREPEDDPFDEGTPNLLRWVFGIEPVTDADKQSLPRLLGGPSISFQLGTDAEDAGVLLQEEWSYDLHGWSTTTPPGVQKQRQGDIVTWNLADSVPLLFFRVRATLP